jgi:hypothetical protein
MQSAAQEREMTNQNIKKMQGVGLLEVIKPLVLIRERHVNQLAFEVANKEQAQLADQAEDGKERTKGADE